MSSYGVAVVVALVILAVPIFLAIASDRGWLPERFWDPPPHRELTPRRRWAVSVVVLALYLPMVIVQWREGDPALAVVFSLQAALWAAWPHVAFRRSHRRREE